jgi:hypothetical protein
VTRLVLLDVGSLGLLSYPKAEPAAVECDRWLQALLASGCRVIVPEIADFEVRRELLRVNLTKGLRRLDSLTSLHSVSYLPLTTPMMRQAAQFWATARRRGRPTADPHALDCDVILAAQATLLERDDDTVVVATTNLRHLSLFVHAQEWWTISPD